MLSVDCMLYHTFSFLSIIFCINKYQQLNRMSLATTCISWNLLFSKRDSCFMFLEDCSQGLQIKDWFNNSTQIDYQSSFQISNCPSLPWHITTVLVPLLECWILFCPQKINHDLESRIWESSQILDSLRSYFTSLDFLHNSSVNADVAYSDKSNSKLNYTRWPFQEASKYLHFCKL